MLRLTTALHHFITRYDPQATPPRPALHRRLPAVIRCRCGHPIPSKSCARRLPCTRRLPACITRIYWYGILVCRGHPECRIQNHMAVHVHPAWQLPPARCDRCHRRGHPIPSKSCGGGTNPLMSRAAAGRPSTSRRTSDTGPRRRAALRPASRASRAFCAARCGTPQHGLSSKMMALITSD